MSENNFGELLSNNFCASSKPEDKKEVTASRLNTEPLNEEVKDAKRISEYFNTRRSYGYEIWKINQLQAEIQEISEKLNEISSSIPRGIRGRGGFRGRRGSYRVDDKV